MMSSKRDNSVFYPNTLAAPVIRKGMAPVHNSIHHAVSTSACYLKSNLCCPVGFQATLAVAKVPLTDRISKDGFKFVLVFTFVVIP